MMDVSLRKLGTRNLVLVFLIMMYTARSP